jgi:hypothetical protein
MKKFPNHINIKNKTLVMQPYKNNFEEINYQRILELLRKEIYEHLISRKDENDYFDIEIFCKRYNYTEKENFSKILKIVLTEITELGWKTQLSFGDTGLFIYSTKEKPSSCW